VLLVPLSLGAALASIGLVAGRGSETSGWPIAVPAAIPLLVIGYCVVALSPSMRAAVPITMVTRVVWLGVLALSLIPWPMRRARAAREVVTDAQRDANTKAREDGEQAALDAAFATLTPERPLRDWLAVATTRYELRERVLAGVRTLPDRQAQAESLRGDDQAMLMSELRNLGLVATPALCRASDDFLVAHAESFRGKAATTTRYEIESASLERYLFAMQWLATNGCDLARSIAATDAVVRLYPADPSREQFLTRLAAMRRAGEK
jgi:hypothetical protein